MLSKEEVLGCLRSVEHPGRGDKDIVSLGLVHSVEVSEGAIHVTLAFPKRPDPLKNYLIGAARAAIYRLAPGGADIQVSSIVAEEPKRKPAPELSLEQLREVSHIIGVASGKGGVGKSTVAVNLAVALARLGYRVGLADADVYGPSVPIMTGTQDYVPPVLGEEGSELFVPAEKFGVKWMSVGYFAGKDQALIWRGPMACSALKQMILQVEWGPLDFLLIDMPPGTGDIHISLVGDIPMEGALLVTTPQDVALADVRKGADMFRNPSVNRRIFGLVENMAWFTPEAHPDEKYYLFGEGGGAAMAAGLQIPLLGQIPLVQGIREGGDRGEPVALGTRPDSLAFVDLASALVKQI
ncbi:MAG: Mrp/NBP35 family ATP-binding protein [Bacteroidales bacterium]|nr:Mrp/NBP35 family ATP-binding protein [Bacteroidales bacterium]